mmetsp:Transcript_11174/g.50642  ORF Transcript_11174/g.50642 Transcript_11174/m.50642 type:complete len:270 (-) Transcript_11174:3423-4232(-)
MPPPRARRLKLRPSRRNTRRLEPASYRSPSTPSAPRRAATPSRRWRRARRSRRFAPSSTRASGPRSSPRGRRGASRRRATIWKNPFDPSRRSSPEPRLSCTNPARLSASTCRSSAGASARISTARRWRLWSPPRRRLRGYDPRLSRLKTRKPPRRRSSVSERRPTRLATPSSPAFVPRFARWSEGPTPPPRWLAPTRRRFGSSPPPRSSSTRSRWRRLRRTGSTAIASGSTAGSRFRTRACLASGRMRGTSCRRRRLRSPARRLRSPVA